jgi:hypothetical protein
VVFVMEKSSACLPSEGKSNNLSHVPTLGHAKEPSSCGSLRAAGKIRIPSLIEASRAGVPLEMEEETILIWGTKGTNDNSRQTKLSIDQRGLGCSVKVAVACILRELSCEISVSTVI